MTVGSKVKQTHTTLKGIESTLRIYMLQSDNEESRLAFKNAINTTELVLKDLEDRFKFIKFEEPQYKDN